jgi:hypothetical protein
MNYWYDDTHKTEISALSEHAHKAFHAGDVARFIQLCAAMYHLVDLTGDSRWGHGEKCDRCDQIWPDYSHGMGKWDAPGCPGCDDKITTIERIIYKAKTHLRGY